jgi:hypothetical protein
LTEKLLWQVFEDPETLTVSRATHYAAAVKAAVIDIEPHLRALYEKATLKYKTDYETVLWAVADHHLLKRRSADIFVHIARDPARPRAFQSAHEYTQEADARINSQGQPAGLV